MRILGIETSCDDTGIAVVEVAERPWPSFYILSNQVASQIDVHRQYGGVYPALAKREHVNNLPVVLKEALKKAKLSLKDPKIDMISVTYGPGLSPCLWTGITFAKELAKEQGIPLVAADHMEGHLLMGLFGGVQEKKAPFPAVVLLVSGGHTELLLMNGIGKYKRLGETRDDAAGEAFDKTARILGLLYPGGPEIAKQAKQANLTKLSLPKLNLVKLPRPMVHTKDFDFSFSGLKTAVLYDYKKRTIKERESQDYIQSMAKEIQQAIVDVLISKTLKAAIQYGAKSIVLGGGVSANDELRKQLQYRMKQEGITIPLFLPKKELAGDNGVMPAIAGYFLFKKKTRVTNFDSLVAEANLRLE